MNAENAPQCATYDAARSAVVVTSLPITHPAVTSEALRWSTGERGSAVAPGMMDGADLTRFVNQALIIGTQAIATVGGVHDFSDHPDNPPSRLARHSGQLDHQYQGWATATGAATNVSPLMGATYETRIHALMESIAAGLGDEYTGTSTTQDHRAHRTKGDGLLAVDGGRARVVVEARDSEVARTWGPYLDVVERNRQASASLGLVPTTERNGGESIRVLGPRRIVMAFDPATGDTNLLRMAVQLLRTAAIAAADTVSPDSARIALERISEGLRLLTRLDDIAQAAETIRRNADTVHASADGLRAEMGRHLLQAQTALAGEAPAIKAPSAMSATEVA